MAVVAQDPFDKAFVAPAIELHLNVVIKLKRQNVYLCEAIDEVAGPGTEVGRVAESPRFAAAVEAKTERDDIVPQGQRRTGASAEIECLAGMILSDQARALEIAKGIAAAL